MERVRGKPERTAREDVFHRADRPYPFRLFLQQIGSDAGVGAFCHFGRRALGDDAAAFLARARPHFDQMLRMLEHMDIVVHDDDRIAVCQKVVHHAEESLDICRMQADRRLVEHVENACRPVAHRTRELHTLALSCRERIARAVKRKIAKAELLETGERLIERRDDG